VTDHAARNSIAQALQEATARLTTAGCDTPRLDAEVLLAHVVGQGRAWLYAHPEHIPSPAQLNVYHTLLERRAGREPVAYLTGSKEFYGLEFLVTPDVLIPRPETERLVEIALEWLATGSPEGLVVDAGTGSGAIAVTLAVHVARAHMLATDTSPAALAVARRNAARHGVAARVHCVQADLLAPLAGELRLIVANPPYLSRAELDAAAPEVARYEPRSALDGGPDGLAILDRLLAMASFRLSPGGALLVEIGADQGERAWTLARSYFPAASVQVARDYAGRDRVLLVRAEPAQARLAQ
jgi:release factor glutamine methyltransferase